MEEKTILSVIATVFGVFVIANLILLNYTVFRVLPARLSVTKTEAVPFEPTSPTTQLPVAQTDTCGVNCQRVVQTALSQVDSKIATLAGRTPAPTKAPTTTPTPLPGAKEFFVPMGTGSTSKSDWEDVAGTDVFVNTDNFAGIKTVYFEVSMHIPTKNGVMTARLFNVTDKHPVWYSDVSTEQDTSTFVASKITLDTGNKQYRVQLKTSLQYPSLLDSARIKILTQ